MIAFYSFSKQNNHALTDRCSLVFNAANLPDPSRAMKRRNGTNKDLQRELFADKRVVAFYEDIVDKVLERAATEKEIDAAFTLHIGVHCLRGMHRSVAIVERLEADTRFSCYETTKIHAELK